MPNGQEAALLQLAQQLLGMAQSASTDTRVASTDLRRILKFLVKVVQVVEQAFADVYAILIEVKYLEPADLGTSRIRGIQKDLDITFLSDGGDTVRDLQLYLSPQSEHVLDWFHITMRLTVMQQMAKGLPDHEILKDVEPDLDRVKWYLWHGNVFQALQVTETIEIDLDSCDDEIAASEKRAKLTKMVREFRGYIETNSGFIPNYGERYQYGEAISTAFVESTINWVVSKRMVKKQQMRWTKPGAHLLLQVRTKTLNGELRDTFCQWYPLMTPMTEDLSLAA